jgi:anaerobic selenocysteine-containing dehydrogenase
MPRSDTLSWGHSTVETGCPLDCPDNCSLAVSVEKGRITRIDGTSRSPTTNGFICAKVRHFADRVYGDARILHPAVRRGRKGAGVFARVSWDEALTLVAERLQETRARSGGEAILPFCYGGSNGLVTQDSVDADLFRRLGASRLARTVCAAATGAAAQGLYGRMPGVAYEDYAHAQLIVVWGANPSASGIHLVPFIRDAQKRGARLVVIDPRATPLARTATLHLALRPGTDLPVALALHRHLFESGRADTAFLAAHATGADELRRRAEAWPFDRAARIAGVDCSALEQVAEWYADTHPALIRCGWGLERNRNGGSAVAAVLALPAVAGKFGRRGGGYTMSNSAAWGLSPEAWSRTPPADTRIVNMNRLGRVLEEARPPVEVLFVYNANPVATVPEQNRVIHGLMRDDLFTIVFDQVMTDTARFADVILPATTFLESYDIAKGYGAYSLQLVKPVIDAIGESRPNVEVFGELLDRLDLLHAGEVAEDDAEALMRVAAALPPALREAVLGDRSAEPPTGAAPVQFVDVFPQTPDRRIHLLPPALEAEAPNGLYGYQEDPASPAYPLALISPASERTISSTLGELRQGPARLYMHTEDALARGLADGDAVRVYNDLGDVHCVVTIGDRIARGTVSLPKGLWRHRTFNEATANALVSDHLTDLGGGACFNDARVEVVRVIAAGYGDRSLGVFVATSPTQPRM